MIKVGLLGAGRIGKVHARSIAADRRSQLVAVSDIDAQAARELASTHGARPLSSQEIMADPGIDAVLIATSTDTHAALIEAAVRAGKAVLCEKPVDLNLERALACQAVVAKVGRPVMIGFNRRFDPNFAALKRAFDAGEIGKGELLSITSFDPAPPPVGYVKLSGGLFRDMAIHDFDMACWIFGAAPASVTAIGSSIVDPAIGAAGDLDTAVITLHFADGRMAVVKNSRRAVYGYDQRIELLGSDGLLSAGNVLEHTVTRITTAGAQAAKPEYFFLERYMKAYAAEWSAFVDAVQSGSDYPVTLQDGVHALAVADAATLSWQEGRTVKLIGGRPA
ncbi:inositol 2-dehydrogenase [Verminephrobacter aporrectodeae subsp. tuberculatae]|uniref:Inositol 2-dehydrogenase n=1 Tax=Verminephrobacter aporrectodeae subsp. tuberculatae TaxID=1110392 RepID=A0ABT3KYL7_9BURK|nr:inositol 2-dehydrogenase [Verminephrobacter aporrectodeae]MCW5323410.1 inositol 2-dehydrogenase [Verminephrobacter aporrectodeae subsp. tuberculatae]